MGGWPGEIGLILQEELALSSLPELTRSGFRLLVAVLLGALVGYDRERKDRAAGLRTHMLVALGAALFVVAGLNAGMDNADVSRILQGIIAGIGFLGAGAIIKLSEKEQVKGLTTAAGIWATAAIGITAGMGHILTATLSALLVVLILAVLPRLENRINERNDSDSPGRATESADGANRSSRD
jgi:putative Mg2+ transporter-C (MgtC) family protein